MLWFILLLILMGGTFYFYQRMRALEREIQAAQALEKTRQQYTPKEAAAGSEPLSPPASGLQTASFSAKQPLNSAQDPLVTAIQSQPGVRQADIYAILPELGKRQIQQTIRQLEGEGKIRRERSGSSYQLYLE